MPKLQRYDDAAPQPRRGLLWALNTVSSAPHLSTISPLIRCKTVSGQPWDRKVLRFGILCSHIDLSNTTSTNTNARTRLQMSSVPQFCRGSAHLAYSILYHCPRVVLLYSMLLVCAQCGGAIRWRTRVSTSTVAPIHCSQELEC